MNLREKVFQNIGWRFAERIGAQLISFVVSVLLARLLEPSDYGKVAMITVFVSILQVFVDGGFGNALVQKKDADDLDFSSVFVFNIIFCFVLYLVLFFFSPLIASFYNDPDLTNMFRVASFVVIISGLKNVQQAYISKTLQFKRFFYATLIGTLGSGIVGIIMAYSGFGPWALVTQHVINALIDTICVWVMVSWHPSMNFSFGRLKSLFSYGWKLLFSNLIDNFYGNMRQLVIGKVYSSSDLAFYNRGRYIPNLIVTNVNTSIDSVLFPVLSIKQDDIEHVREITKKAIKTSNYIMAPLLMGITFMAEPIVRLLLTEKWIPCVPFVRVFCFLYMFQPIHTVNTNVIKALGRSDIRLLQEIITKIVGIILLILSLPYGTLAIAYAYLAGNFFNQFVNSWPNKRLLNYSFFDQIKDIAPSTVLAVMMGFLIYTISFFNFPLEIEIILQFFTGAIFYITGSLLLRIDTFCYLLDVLRKLRF